MSGSAHYSDQMALRIRSLRRGAFASLLRGDVFSEEEARAILPYFEICYGQAGYSIAVAEARRLTRLSRFSDDEHVSPGGDAERVLRVHIGDHGYVYRRTDDELVIFWSHSRSSGEAMLRERILSAAAELESRNGATLEFGIGGTRMNLVEIPDALREAAHRGEPEAVGPTEVLCDREPARSVQQYVLERFQEPNLTLAAIARRFQLSEAYLSQMFRDQTGMTYSLYLERLRVDAAQRLLESSSLSVAETSTRVGYQTNSTFFRAFRRVHGQSPSAYRRKKRSGLPTAG